MSTNVTITSLLAFSLLLGCEKAPQGGKNEADNFVSIDKIVTIDADRTFQTIESFGASDCWTPSYVGKYWTSSRDAITELLFSSEIVNNQPKGIGLSLWRVNLGGGTDEQGDASGIEDVTRRASSYLKDDGTYDWTRCEGQRYFMSRAKELGCNNFLLFSNTPPVQYTYNGKGYSQRGASSNLKDEHYSDFAGYMADVAKHYSDEGYDINYISPVNEPQYNWDGNGQEGSGWRNTEVARLTEELDKALTDVGSDAQIVLGEAAKWDYVNGANGDAARGDVLNAFFNSSSQSYVGDLPHLKKTFAAHSYYTDGSWDAMRSTRQTASQMADEYKVDLWQSEWSMLGDHYDTNEYAGHDNASYLDIAMYMSKVIHNDLTMAGVTSWQYWTAVDTPKWGHKDRFLLVEVTPAGGTDGNPEDEGAFGGAKTLWVLGNYSLFIRPGYQRIDLTLGSESRNFFGSAYISPDRKTIVAVYTNFSDKGIRLIETRKFGGEVKSIMKYTTSGDRNLAGEEVPAGNSVILRPESVTTLVYNLQ